MRAIDVIIKNLKMEPDKWTIDNYRLVHENGTSIWIANGILFYQVEGLFKVFNLWDKIKLHVALSGIKNSCFQKQVINRFKEAANEPK
jgi:hypothetical protein